MSGFTIGSRSKIALYNEFDNRNPINENDNTYIIGNHYMFGDNFYNRNITYHNGKLLFIHGKMSVEDYNNFNEFDYYDSDDDDYGNENREFNSIILNKFNVNLEYVNNKGHEKLFYVLNDLFYANPEINDAFLKLFSINEEYELNENSDIHLTDISINIGFEEISIFINKYEIVDNSQYLLK